MGNFIFATRKNEGKLQNNLQEVRKILHKGSHKLLGDGIDKSDLVFIGSANESYEQVTGIKGMVEESEDDD